MPDATMVYSSADPLRVRTAAVLFVEGLPAGQNVRLAYNHINGTADALTLSLVVLNDTTQPAAIRYIGGYAGPDLDAGAVGHTATAGLFRDRLDPTAPRTEAIPAQSRTALISRGFGPEECLCGIFEIENTSAVAMRVAVVAGPVGLAPSDAVGTLPRAQSTVSSAVVDRTQSTHDVFASVAGTAAVAFALPPVPPIPGIVSTYEISLENDSRADANVDLVYETSGFSSATFALAQTNATSEGAPQLYEVARTPPNSRVAVITIVVPSGTSSLSLVTMSDLNSPSPIVFSFAPSADTIAHGMTAVASVVDSAGSTARGVAAVVRSQPPLAAASRIAEPLASAVLAEAPSLIPHHYDVIVQVDPLSRPTPALARAAVYWLLAQVGIPYARRTDDPTHPYFFASLTAAQIVALLAGDDDLAGRSRLRSLIAKVWQDHVVTAQIIDSVPTLQADAAHTSFNALGAGIVWAVIDSGVERHPHFEAHGNLLLPDGLSHRDYRGAVPVDVAINALTDEFGHGTHVAGIIAGEWTRPQPPTAAIRVRNEGTHQVSYVGAVLEKHVGGVAPKCKIVSMRVLDAFGTGNTRGVISALEDVLAINDYGRNIRIHGVNLSVGYTFDADWEACGATPICAAVDRLVASGVVVVVAAGNSGDILLSSAHGGLRQSGAGITINDPGNAARAITVGSCYKREPHTRGIAPSSSKGPTGDGRPKPDVVAPGERILSCASASRVAAAACVPPIEYIEDSGTSMSAPHVSGAAAAYLSVRREFLGRPDDIKDLIVSTATDLKRDRSFQGAGLIDLFRMLVNS
jgi:serine protease AprX